MGSAMITNPEAHGIGPGVASAREATPKQIFEALLNHHGRSTFERPFDTKSPQRRPRVAVFNQAVKSPLWFLC